MNRFKPTIAIAGTLLLATQAFAGGLFAPFSMDSASVMPKGVRSFRLGGFTTEVSDKYNANGEIRPLADKFNRSVSWRRLINSQPQGFERGKFMGGLESMGVDLDSEAGDTRGLIDTRVTSTIPVFAYGLTEKLTLGVGLPIMYSNVNVSTGWSANGDFQNTVDMLSQRGFHNQALSYEADLYNVVATEIRKKGYKDLVDEQHSDIGDVTLAAKYQAYKDSMVAVAVAPKLVVPTGRTPDVDKVVDIAPGDGQWDVGVSTVVDVTPISKLTLTTAAGYTYQAPATKAKRIPVSADETLSADVDSDVHEKLGDVMNASLGARYKIHELWTAGMAYAYQYKIADSYSGNKYDSARYDVLAQDTEQRMQTAQVGLSYSTVPLFVAKKFMIPLEASVNYSSVLSGRNVNKIDLTSVELVAFF